MPASRRRSPRPVPRHARNARTAVCWTGAVSSAVEQWTFNPLVDGSIPSRPTTLFNELWRLLDAIQCSKVPFRYASMQEAIRGDHRQDTFGQLEGAHPQAGMADRREDISHEARCRRLVAAYRGFDGAGRPRTANSLRSPRHRAIPGACTHASAALEGMHVRPRCVGHAACLTRSMPSSAMRSCICHRS